MELFAWALVFVVALGFLVKGADWLLGSASVIGKSLGLSPFVVGVLLVGIGTSLPELASSLAAVFAGASEVVVANAVGSNIANILLVIGLSALVGRGLGVSKNLIDLDIPLLAISTTLFLGVVIDGKVVLGESLLLLTLVVVYTTYILVHSDEPERRESVDEATEEKRPIQARDVGKLVIGVFALIGGAKYLIDATIEISVLLGIGVSVISLVAIAFGTSLPELIVSVKAALKGQAEMALGNIFGSNVFNLLLVVGIPGLFKTLPLDESTFLLGLPVMVAATFLFVISGISRKVHSYEGAAYLVFYLFFLGKLFEFI